MTLINALTSVSFLILASALLRRWRRKVGHGAQPTPSRLDVVRAMVAVSTARILIVKQALDHANQPD
ncbi:hypothetical protein [Paenarthrobacter sp. YIM B13468]|uniref:hypothetical protein n=1 Tax=Paenarthrobacter sp. YIM B13468 TaxID=3366295 RepID=UPI003672756A